MRLDQKAKVNFEIYEVTDLTANNCNISSRSKGNLAMEFVQLLKCHKRNVFLQNHAENEAGRLFLDLFLFYEKASCKVKRK